MLNVAIGKNIKPIMQITCNIQSETTTYILIRDYLTTYHHKNLSYYEKGNAFSRCNRQQGVVSEFWSFDYSFPYSFVYVVSLIYLVLNFVSFDTLFSILYI